MKSVAGFDSPLRPIQNKGEPMEYKGIELKEVTEPQLFNPPKRMLVWDNYEKVELDNA